MSQQPPPQPPHGNPQWGQQAPFPYGQAPMGNPPQPEQSPQRYPSSGQAQWGQQVPPPSPYGRAPVGYPPVQQPFTSTMPYPGPSQLPPSSPNTGPQSKQRGFWPWYKRQGRGGKIALVCGLLIAVLLLGSGLTLALGSMHGSTPSASSAGQRAAASPTTTPPLAPTRTPTHKPKPSTTVVIVSRADFSPATLTIAVGSTVIWKNKGPVAHTVTSDDGTFDSGDLPAGGTFRFTFSTSGTFPYTCNYHPYMTGTIIVQQT